MFLQDLINDYEQADIFSEALALVESVQTQEILLNEESLVPVDPSTRPLDKNQIVEQMNNRVWKLDLLFELVTPMSKIYGFIMGQGPFTKLLIGRSAKNDIVLDDPAVSSVHAYVERNPQSNRYALTDVKSRNGTRINTLRLKPDLPYILHPGDCICFGRAIYYVVPYKGIVSLMEHFNVNSPL